MPIQVTLEEAGFMTLTIKPQPTPGVPTPETVTKCLDVYEEHDGWFKSYHEANKDLAAVDYNRGIVQHLVDLGFPPCSQALAVNYVIALTKQVRVVSNFFSAMLASLDSTAVSTPGAAPSASAKSPASPGPSPESRPGKPSTSTETASEPLPSAA